MQFLTPLKQDTTTAYGHTAAKGTVFFLRQEFGTVKNPFAFSTSDQAGSKPPRRSALHRFRSVRPALREMRLEMDGVEHQQRYNLPDENLSFTKFLVTHAPTEHAAAAACAPLVPSRRIHLAVNSPPM